MCNLLHMMCTSCCRSPIAKCTCPIAHSAIMPIDFIRTHQWQTVIKTIISICVPVCVLSFCWCAIVLKFCAWFWRCRAHSHGQKACATRPKHTHKQTNPYARWNADRNAIIIARNEPDERRRRRRLTSASNMACGRDVRSRGFAVFVSLDLFLAQRTCVRSRFSADSV